MTKRRGAEVRTADMIALYRGKLVLIERLRYPEGLALPGGHIDAGETPKFAAVREFTEETGLLASDVRFITRRRGKNRDPRYAMSQTSVYAGIASGEPKDEAGHTKVVLMSLKDVRKLPEERFAFDHWEILQSYFQKNT